MAIIPAKINGHMPIDVLYAKALNHCFIKYHDNGVAIMKDMATSFVNSLVSKLTTLEELAPIALRIPISFVRCSAV